MIKLIKIDDSGVFIEDVIVKEKPSDMKNLIEVSCPDGFYKPKWNGAAWVEGLSQEELDIIKNQPEPLSEIDLLRIESAQANAELFEMMLSMLGGM